ncbi:unnamed protein product [Lactuca saligna]|uniref:Two-component response regulator-like APRR2 n=1 Tax=Lactuca saligna TaxID=75948 RepID=A0AA36E6M3_LACSI|nr:unnamed protein product [Lactuca saligna]
MVCTANDLLEWKDFPKGLRVLLLDEDIDSANVIKSKLEEMDYVVSAFYSENDALSAISEKSKGFHVAIVEVRAGNEDGRFKFLEKAKDLPTIMTSDVNCISTMMKCIALGAVEFLEKPLSEDKLRNIWQHVAHKAFNAGPKDENEALKSEEALILLEKLKQGMRHVDNEDQTNLSTEKECVEHDGESKFVEITCDDRLVVDNVMETNFSKSLEEGINKTSSNECCPDPNDGKKQNEASEHPISRSSKSGRRKVKVDWSSELHKKFVQAVEQLGVDQAIPSRILELMNVEGLTRHNVASHLQKYRLQRRHILPKESGRKWPQTRHHSTSRNYYPQKPIMAYPPPYHSNQVYPSWPPPPNYPPPPQTWGPPYYPAWHSPVSWLWNPYPETQAETWGCPTIPSHPSFPQNVSQFQSNQTMPKNSFDQYPGDEVIDKVVKEAINKPWLPLPLGLKPPSTESVISELTKQGISTVPPKINGCH